MGAARLTASVNALHAAEADAALARAQRQELQVRLDRTTIRAPVAGVVSRRTARLGAVVGMTGEPLFRLIAGGAVELEAGVPETRLAQIRPGQPATLAAAGSRVPAHVRLVSPEVSQATRLGRVRIAPDGDAAPGAIGSFARATVEVARAGGVVVPLSAVLFDPDAAHVQVVAGGVVQTRTGHGDAAQRRAGAAGRRRAGGRAVVSVSGTFVRDGDRVTPVGEHAPAGAEPMALKISGASIRKPIPALVLFAVLLVLGVVSFRAIPITRAPNVDVPVVSVTVTQSGAAPAELETQVTRKVEDSIASVSGVKHVTSSVTDGASTTLVELRLEVSTDRALNDVRDAVAKIRADLPRTIEEPIIERIDVVGQAIQTFAASAPGMTPEQLSWFIDDTVLRALQGVPGVGRVERIGGVTREIEVDLDPDRLAALGVTAGQVNAQLRATNVDLAGGRGEVGGQEQAIRTLANAGSVAALADSRIVLPGGREVRLSDVATVTDGFEEPRSFARLDGTPPWSRSPCSAPRAPAT